MPGLWCTEPRNSDDGLGLYLEILPQAMTSTTQVSMGKISSKLILKPFSGSLWWILVVWMNFLYKKLKQLLFIFLLIKHMAHGFSYWYLSRILLRDLK